VVIPEYGMSLAMAINARADEFRDFGGLQDELVKVFADQS